MKGEHGQKTKYRYWTIQRVENGYLVKNSQVTVTFASKMRCDTGATATLADNIRHAPEERTLYVLRAEFRPARR